MQPSAVTRLHEGWAPEAAARCGKASRDRERGRRCVTGAAVAASRSNLAGKRPVVSSMSIPISYQLVIEVRAPVRCEVGRLGVFDFPAGTYVYTGSARRGFEARLARHTRATKALRWHIDYLLTAPGVRIVKIVRSGRDECRLNRAVNGTVWVPGFGASDCTVGCGAHLKYRGPLAGSLPTARVDAG